MVGGQIMSNTDNRESGSSNNRNNSACIITKSKNVKKYICFAIMAVAGTALAAIELSGHSFSDNKKLAQLISMILTRVLGGIVFIAAAVYLGYNILKPFGKNPGRSLLFTLPCFAVAINNFPFVGVISGNVKVTEPTCYIALLAAECLAIGFFEEFAFRGVVFLIILEKKRSSVKDIFVSIVSTSAIFGVVHLLNLFRSFDFGGTLMQIGYSFLIGGMCAVILIKTYNIWLCVAVHAIFDFGGYFVQIMGTGNQWDPVTVILTAVVAVIVAVYIIYSLIKYDPRELDGIFGKTTGTADPKSN